MAASYLQQIKQVQPNGEFMIGGASFGGLVAYEIAQQLCQEGRAPSFLFFLDTPSPENYPKELPSDSEILHYMLTVGAQHTPPQEFMSYSLDEQLSYFLNHAGGLGEAIPHFNQEHLKHYLTLYKANIQAMLSYDVKAPHADMPLSYYYRAEERDAVNPEHPEYGWKDIFHNKLYVDNTQGNHITMLFEPWVRDVGDKIVNVLES